MEVSMESLAQMTLYAFFLGVALGLLYDVFRIMRVMIGVSYGGKSAEHLYAIEYPLIGRLKRKKGVLKKGFTDVFIGIGDIIFSILSGIMFSVFIYYTNDGIFRIQAFVATIVGFILYYNTFGAIFIFFAEIISIFLKIIIKIFLYAIAFPFRIMYNILVRFIKKTFGVPFSWLLRKADSVITGHKMKAMMREASTGFLKNM